VLDALPCARFVVHETRVRALGVAVAADGAFMEREAFADELLVRYAQPLVDEFKLADGYRSECAGASRPGLRVYARASRTAHPADSTTVCRAPSTITRNAPTAPCAVTSNTARTMTR